MIKRDSMCMLVRYLASGGLGLAVNMSMFALLVNISPHYLIASTAAITISTVVGFILQKYWTFGDRAHARAWWQFLLYGCVALINLSLNAAVVYACVELLALPPLMGQAVGAATVALWSFFAYRHVIFTGSFGAERFSRLYWRLWRKRPFL